MKRNTSVRQSPSQVQIQIQVWHAFKFLFTIYYYVKQYDHIIGFATQSLRTIHIPLKHEEEHGGSVVSDLYVKR